MSNSNEQRGAFVWIDTRMVSSPEVQAMTTRQFGRAIKAAMEGKRNALSRYISQPVIETDGGDEEAVH